MVLESSRKKSKDRAAWSKSSSEIGMGFLSPPLDSEPPVSINMKNILLPISCQLLEKGLTAVADPIWFSRDVLREFLFVEDLVARGQSRINMDKGPEEPSRSEPGEPLGDVNGRGFLLNELLPREGVHCVSRNASVIADSGSKEVENLHVDPVSYTHLTLPTIYSV